jgi:predicted ATPase/DNA-binding winged helix-turn-helix (wHTH) protein
MNISLSAPRQTAPPAAGTPPSRFDCSPGVESDRKSAARDIDQPAQANRPRQSPATSIRFGSFCLWPVQRLLLQDDQPIHIGSRALDILIALLERPGELVAKEELMARVWPNTFVEPANLTVHIAALRRALGDGRDGNRFLINIPGRGYRFVAPVMVSEQPLSADREPAIVGHLHNLPAKLGRLIGRDEVVARLSAQLTQDRFLSIVGQGGIGKTSVALAVAETGVAKYRDGTWLIDLAGLDRSQAVAEALAFALGLELHSHEPLAGAIAALRDKQMLLVLDNCEHVVAPAAGLIAAILRDAPGVQVLATSREPLRTEGEQVYRLAGSESPPIDCTSAEQALRFPAVQLFVKRAAAAVGEFALSDADAPAAAAICSKLDGNPLAIELAAMRVNSLGIGGLAAGLEDPLRLLTNGRRTAPARQQTMRATLDWSHDLLTEPQQRALRRLAIFSGDFSLSAATAIISERGRPDCHIVDEVMDLVGKSLIASEAREAQPRFRLPHIARAYALEKLRESGELDSVSLRHAEYFRGDDDRR